MIYSLYVFQINIHVDLLLPDLYMYLGIKKKVFSMQPKAFNSPF